jgi:hypothetical protein
MKNMTVYLLFIYLIACSQTPALDHHYNPFQFEKVATLPPELKETSGLALLHSYLISHNDQQNKAALYLIDTTHAHTVRTIRIIDAPNQDWEDLSIDKSHLYIADIGNNKGRRTTFQIYAIPLQAIIHNDSTPPKPEYIIQFDIQHPEINQDHHQHNRDFEALICRGESLYIFSKNRADDSCSIYRIPNKAGFHTAEKITTFQTMVKITGADLFEDKLCLIGYEKKGSCVAIIWKDMGKDFQSGQRSTLHLGAYEEIGQIEGVCFSSPKTLYISSEATKHLPASLYKLTLESH